MGALSEPTHTRYPVKDPEDAGHLRRVVNGLSRSAGASPAETGRVELAVTELATNLLRHAKPGGFILVRPLVTHGHRGVEILSVDHGPGMFDARSHINEGAPRLLDGSGRGNGVGLGSVQRLSTLFDIYSQLGKGTVVLSRHFFGERPKRGAFDVGGISVAIPGEAVSGDGWAIRAFSSQCSVLLVDGLGHGPKANQAAEVAIDVLGNGYSGDIEAYVQKANAAMRHTRGGVLGIAHIDPVDERLQFVGVGNIEGRVILPERGSMLTSRNGTVGLSMNAPPTRIVDHPWAPGAVLLLHSDGVKFRLDEFDYPGLFQRDPAVIAAVAMRDGFRGTDDATVVVVKDARGARGGP